MVFPLRVKVALEGCAPVVKEVEVGWPLMLVLVFRLLLVWSSVSGWSRFGCDFGLGLVYVMSAEVEEVLSSAVLLLLVAWFAVLWAPRSPLSGLRRQGQLAPREVAEVVYSDRYWEILVLMVAGYLAKDYSRVVS